MKKFAPAITAALIFGTTGAFAHDYNNYGQPAHNHAGTSYTAPTIDLGPIEYAQPQSTVSSSYVSPANTTTYAPYNQPATSYSYTTPATTYTAAATTTYTAPVSSYTTTPSYTAPTYTQPAYTTPTYTAPTYRAPTYTTPGYTAPTYTTPSYPASTLIVPSYGNATGYASRYDGRAIVRSRLQRQRNRIERALERGDLRPREHDKLMNRMQDIRQIFRDFRRNDGVVSQSEEAKLMAMLDRQSRRIRRLANNDRVAGGHGGYNTYRAY